MKKVVLLVVCMLLLLSLCACSRIKLPYTVEEQRRTFTINPINRTITDQRGTYQYEITGTMSDHEITITYPNGVIYHYTRSGSYRWKEGDETTFDYTPGAFLCDALEGEIPADPFDDTILGFVIMVLGALFFFAPKVAWFIGLGGFFRKTKPADTTLLLYSICGGFVFIAGILMFI